MIAPYFPSESGVKSIAKLRFETLSIQMQWINVAGELAQTMTRDAYTAKFAEINSLFTQENQTVARTIGELIQFLRQPESSIPSDMLQTLSADNSLLLAFLNNWKGGAGNKGGKLADAAEKLKSFRQSAYSAACENLDFQTMSALDSLVRSQPEKFSDLILGTTNVFLPPRLLQPERKSLLSCLRRLTHW